MLAAANRLGDAASFREVSRRGRRAASSTLVVHLLGGDLAGDPAESPAGQPVAERVLTGADARVGLVVSRAVGNSVTRNQVKRRLRHLLRARLELISPGTRVVVRALPAAASSSSARLGRDLDRCLERAAADDGGRAR
ncbi:MAG: ribonuclease P protein component [Nocardioides sp.]